MKKSCWQCGTFFDCKPSYYPKKFYCSKGCMAVAYRSRLRGRANPNFRNAGIKSCETCGRVFKCYQKNYRHCSLSCRSRAPRNLEQCRRMAKRNRKPGREPRPCLRCGEVYEPAARTTKYCSVRCAGLSQRGYKFRARRDANHKEIVAALRMMPDVSYIDTAELGGGFADLVVGRRGQTFLLEVKNPTTPYGRQGFSKSQRAWNARWKGSLPILVRNTAEALEAIGCGRKTKES